MNDYPFNREDWTKRWLTIRRLIYDIEKSQPQNPVLDTLRHVTARAPLAIQLTVAEQELVRPFRRFDDCF